jgi:protein-disulfide isomerase
MTNTRWLVFIGICLAILGGLVVATRRDKVNVSNVDPSIVATTGDTADHVFGKKDSKVVLIEYGDFQCPSCGRAHLPLKTLTETYKGQVAFVFRNFPLTTIHPNALSSASAAEAAGLQGKYWEMYDMLYTKQNEWSTFSPTQRTEAFTSYAKDLGLNTAKFATDLESKPVSTKINYDRALANKLNVDSTPTLYIGSTKIDNDTLSKLVQGDSSALKAKLDEALRAAGYKLPSTTSTETPAQETPADPAQ